MEDNFAWHFDQRGIFSVKSAYKIGVMLRDRRLGRDVVSSKENSANSTVKFDWKHVWSLKATSKVKMFVWRLAHNSLANSMKIQKLGMDLDTRCRVCHRLNEDGGHTFLKCKKAKECWNILALAETREKLMLCNSAHSMLQELWRCDEDTQQLKVVTFMWEWWNVRNKTNAACLAAIDGAIRIGANRIIFESDSSTLIHALKSNEYDKATIALLRVPAPGPADAGQADGWNRAKASRMALWQQRKAQRRFQEPPRPPSSSSSERSQSPCHQCFRAGHRKQDCTFPPLCIRCNLEGHSSG
nr:uncharacterized protein LOC109756417 [Aegilops tauschii subsp. strangulata]